jgi:HSP20 family protein
MALVPSFYSPGNLFGPIGSDPFLTLHREMNRMFDEIMRGSWAGTGQSGNRSGALMAPSMDVTESDKEVRIQAELPGVNEKVVELSLNDDLLTLRAEKRQERKEEREGAHVSERSYGTFQRSLRLPFQVSPDQVQARFENGVLTITLPKSRQQERSRRIQIQGAQSPSGAQRVGGSSDGSDGQGTTAQAGTTSEDGAISTPIVGT